MCQYPQDKTKDVKMPAELRVNIWLGLSAVEKKFNSFAEGTFSVFAEMVCPALLSYFKLGCECWEFNAAGALLNFFALTERETSVNYKETSRTHSRQLIIKSIVPTRWTSADQILNWLVTTNLVNSSDFKYIYFRFLSVSLR